VTGLPLARWRPGPCSVIIVETALGLPGLPKISPEATAPPFVRCLFTCADFVSVEARTAAAGPVLVFFERARVVFHLPQRAAVGSPGLSRIAPPPPEWLGFCVAVFVFPEQRRRFPVCLLPQSRRRSFLGSLPQASPFFLCFFNGLRVVRYWFLPKRAAGRVCVLVLFPSRNRGASRRVLPRRSRVLRSARRLSRFASPATAAAGFDLVFEVRRRVPISVQLETS
jgi:hypothetical protein